MRFLRSLGLGWAVSLALGTASFAADLPSRTAQPAAPAPVTDTWSGNVTLYGWAIGMNGTVQTFSRLPPARVNIGFDEILKNLDGGIMLAGSATNGRYVVLGDIIYAKLSPKKDFGRFDTTITLDTQQFMGLAMGGYRVFADPSFSLDALIGARVFSVSTGLTVTLPRMAAEIADRSKTWVDGVVGLRGMYHFTPNFHLTAIALGGGLSSQYEWDLFAGLSYDFASMWSVSVGYRALGVNYRSDGFIYDVVQHGPLVGISARF